MKLNKIASAVILSMGMFTFGANAADQGSGSVTFTGNIIEAPCSIAPDSVDQTVPLGQIAKSALMGGGKSNPVHFDIKLENCTLDSGTGEGTTRAAKNTVTIKFTGASANDTDTLLKIEGSAKGAGVGITDPNGKAVKLGTASDAINLVDAATNTLDLYGHLEGIDDKTLTEGSFEAVSHFTLDYQ